MNNSSLTAADCISVKKMPVCLLNFAYLMLKSPLTFSLIMLKLYILKSISSMWNNAYNISMQIGLIE